MNRLSHCERRRDVPYGTIPLLLLLAACSAIGPPPMEPLTEKALEAAERRWQGHGSDSYHLVVRVRAPRVDPAVYDLVVAAGRVARVEPDGRVVPASHADDYSVPSLFHLLRQELRLIDERTTAHTRPVDLRARFEAETGRLELYRRTVGTDRRRVLLIEVLKYEPYTTSREVERRNPGIQWTAAPSVLAR